MTTLTIETEDKEVLKAVRALLKGFGVSYKEHTTSPYNPEFVAQISKSEKQIKEGKTIKMTKEELKALLK